MPVLHVRPQDRRRARNVVATELHDSRGEGDFTSHGPESPFVSHKRALILY
jgi:hypothetical protein